MHHFLERYIPNKPQSLESSLHAWFIALSVNLEHALDFKGQRMCNNCNNILFQVNWYINCLGAVFKISAALIYTSVYAYRVRVCVSVFISCVILFWPTLKISCSTCRVITMDKNCIENIHERLNSPKMKFWYTTKLFISAEQFIM